MNTCVERIHLCAIIILKWILINSPNPRGIEKRFHCLREHQNSLMLCRLKAKILFPKPLSYPPKIRKEAVQNRSNTAKRFVILLSLHPGKQMNRTNQPKRPDKDTQKDFSTNREIMIRRIGRSSADTKPRSVLRSHGQVDVFFISSRSRIKTSKASFVPSTFW